MGRRGSNAQGRKEKQGGVPEGMRVSWLKVALFVMAVALAVWVPISYLYAASRSDNVLDEVYYATLDEKAGLAISYGHVPLTVIESFFCPFKTGKLLWEAGCSSQYVSPSWLDSSSNERRFGTDGNIFAYEYGERLGGRKLISWYIEDGEPREGKTVRLEIALRADTPSGEA